MRTCGRPRSPTDEGRGEFKRGGRLTAADRRALPDKDFALPGGRYPIPDASHGRNALARAAQNATPAEQATIRRKVHSKYPEIGEK